MMDMNLKLEPSNNVEIWLVRHGETIFNTKKSYKDGVILL